MKGTVYKISPIDTSIADSYIGGTFLYENRKRQHRQASQNQNDAAYGRKLYVRMRETGGFENWEFTVLGEYDGIDRTELKAKERMFIQELRPSLNQKLPELLPVGKYDRTQWKREYQQMHSAELSEKQKVYRKENSEKISVVRKAYREKNKQRLHEENKKYHELNKERTAKRKAMKKECPYCGKLIASSFFAAHKTRQHGNTLFEPPKYSAL